MEPEPEGEPVNIVLLEDCGEMSEIKQEAEDEHNPIDPLSMDFESGLQGHIVEFYAKR